MVAKGLALGLLTIAATAGAAGAQEAEQRFNIHGFGGWAFTQTNDNEYVSGAPDGSYGPVSFALNATAVVSPKLMVIAQPEWHQQQELELELDYAFAEWAFSDALRFRAGRVKHPFGIYTEVYDVGTIRPFQNLPQAMYGHLGFVAEGYNGIGIRGVRTLGRWDLGYDAYVGGLEVPQDEVPTGVPLGGGLETDDESEKAIGEVIGGRLVFHTPVPGLSFGASGYTGTEGEGDESARHSVYGAQVEFLSDRVWLRGEAARLVEVGSTTVEAFYGEGAYFVTSRLQAAARFGRNSTDLGAATPLASSLLDHEELVGGVNFWLAPEFVLKTSFHLIHGNRLARPDDLGSAIQEGALERTTRMVQAGAQFSF